MKKILLPLALALIQMTSFAQAPAIQWQKALGGTREDQAQYIQPTPDGGYIVAGYTISTDGDVTGYHGGTSYCGDHGSQTCLNSDAWVMKLDATGALMWQKTLGGSGIEEAKSIQPTNDGGYIIAGLTTSNDGDVTGNHGDSDAWIVKLTATGTIVWQKALGGAKYDQFYGAGYEAFYSIQPTQDGGYIAAGYISPYADNAWVVKLSTTGAIEWQKSMKGTGNAVAKSIQPTNDGGYIVAGYTSETGPDVLIGYHGYGDAWVAKLSNAGAIEWQKALGGTSNDEANSIQPTPDGGYIVAGVTSSTDGDVTGYHGGYINTNDAWLVKLSATGAIEWQKTLGGISLDSAQSIQTTVDGGYLIAGSTRSTDGDVTGNHGAQDAWVIKLDITGAIVWQKAFGGTNSDYAYNIQPIPKGGYIVAGYTESNDGDVTGNHGGGDVWIVQLGAELSNATFTAQELKLYPNPAKNIVHLQTATNGSLDKITITDLTGKVILTQTINTSQVNIEPLTSGMYIFEAISGEGRYFSKFVKE